MQLKIKTTIDALNPNHVKALNAFLTGIGAAAGAVAKVSEALEPLEEKPKQTRKRAEKVENATEYTKEALEAQKDLVSEQDVKEALEGKETKKAEAMEVVEPETVSAPTLMQIRSLVAQKAGEHKVSIKAKLVELGAQNVSTLDAKHFQTIFDFLTDL